MIKKHCKALSRTDFADKMSELGYDVPFLGTSESTLDIRQLLGIIAQLTLDLHQTKQQLDKLKPRS
jgi:hypothetical protein